MTVKAFETLLALVEGRRRVVASVSPYGNPCARLAPSLLNSPEEVDAALREVRALAAA